MLRPARKLDNHLPTSPKNQVGVKMPTAQHRHRHRTLEKSDVRKGTPDNKDNNNNNINAHITNNDNSNNNTTVNDNYNNSNRNN